jgi:uncharacterized protein (TIGR01777 family)
MKIAIAGGSGFIGEPLVRALLARGDDVAVLTRDPARVRAGRAVEWDPAAGVGAWGTAVATADAVVNLAGENVGEGRWSEERKRRIAGSREKATTALVSAMKTQPERQRVLVNASAVGFYGPRGDEVLDETAATGSGFLAEVVRKWEALAGTAEGVARVVVLRFGVVLAREGGALGKMLLPARLGAGGPMGSGAQWMSWIDRDDIIRMILWAIDTQPVRGTYNATAPHPARNRDFARALGSALHRPAFLPAPAFALRLALGQMADEMLLAGQRVVPERATSEGFSFDYPQLAAALEHALRR